LLADRDEPEVTAALLALLADQSYSVQTAAATALAVGTSQR
jgi:HEAT repeat protein